MPYLLLEHAEVALGVIEREAALPLERLAKQLDVDLHRGKRILYLMGDTGGHGRHCGKRFASPEAGLVPPKRCHVPGDYVQIRLVIDLESTVDDAYDAHLAALLERELPCVLLVPCLQALEVLQHLLVRDDLVQVMAFASGQIEPVGRDHRAEGDVGVAYQPVLEHTVALPAVLHEALQQVCHRELGKHYPLQLRPGHAVDLLDRLSEYPVRHNATSLLPMRSIMVRLFWL